MTAIASSSTPSSSKRSAASAERPKVKRKPYVSHNVDAALSATIGENSAEAYLSSLALVSDRHYLPEPRHMQVLLYLCINPPSSIDPYYPISVLHSLRSHHTPAELTSLMPRIPKSRAERDHPSWLAWTEHIRSGSQNSLDVRVERAMRRCIDAGIWALLWKVPAPSEHQGILPPEDDSELSDEEEGEKLLSDAGWDVLEWLISIWETDEKESGVGWSKCLLEQLPPAVTVLSSSATSGQQTSAMAILDIIKAAYSHTRGNPFQHPTRPLLAVRLLTLLFHCTLGPSPPFSPSALQYSLLTVLSFLPPKCLTHLLALLTPLPWSFQTHLLTLAIEDTSGTRSSKTAARKLDPSLDWDDLPPGEKDCGAYPPPLLSYVLERLLLSSPKSKGEETGERMVVLKEVLLREMILRHPPETPEWSRARAEGYVTSLSMGHSSAIEALGTHLSLPR